MKNRIPRGKKYVNGRNGQIKYGKIPNNLSVNRRLPKTSQRQLSMPVDDLIIPKRRESILGLPL